MKTRWLASPAALVVVIVIVVGIVAAIGHVSSPTNGAVSTNATCHQEKSNGLYLQAMQDAQSGGQTVRVRLLEGVEVKASPTTLCNGTETITAILLQGKTNSSGLVHFDGFYGTYYKVTVTYSGQIYGYTAPMKTNETTFLKIHLPSGSFETNYQYMP